MLCYSDNPQEEKWNLQARIKTLERYLQQNKSTMESLEEQNNDLSVAVEKLTKHNFTHEAKIDELRSANEKTLSEITTLKTESLLFDEKTKGLLDNIEIRRQNNQKLEEEIIKLKRQVETITDTYNRSIEDHNYLEELNKANIALRHDNQMLSDELKSLQNEITIIGNKLNAAVEENIEIRTNYDTLRNKLNILKEINLTEP